MQDPFHLVKEEIQQTLTGINALYDRWKDLLTTTNTAESEEYSWTQNELKEHLQNISTDLTDLDETIRIVQSNTQKYKLDDEELQIRKSFIDSTKKRVKVIFDEMNDNITKSKIERDKKSLLMSRKDEKVFTEQAGNKYQKLDEDGNRENEEFINNATGHQQSMMKKQDEDLTILHGGVKVLKTMAGEIGNKIQEHTVIINDIDNKTNNLTDKIKATQKRLDDLLKKSKENVSYCAIAFLVIVLVILLYFLIKGKTSGSN